MPFYPPPSLSLREHGPFSFRPSTFSRLSFFVFHHDCCFFMFSHCPILLCVHGRRARATCSVVPCRLSHWLFRQCQCHGNCIGVSVHVLCLFRRGTRDESFLLHWCARLSCARLACCHPLVRDTGPVGLAIAPADPLSHDSRGVAAPAWRLTHWTRDISLLQLSLSSSMPTVPNRRLFFCSFFQHFLHRHSASSGARKETDRQTERGRAMYI